jgi:hypothetical protein
VPKPSTALASPDRPQSGNVKCSFNLRISKLILSVASGVVKQAGSTASNLAAVYQQRRVESADLLAKWRKMNQSKIKQPRRDEPTRGPLSAFLPKKEMDSPKKHALSKTPASTSSTINPVKHLTSSGSASGSRMVISETGTQARGASGKNGMLTTQI